MNNRNPYHDYRDIPLIEQGISQILSDDENKNLLLPDVRYKENLEKKDDDKWLKRWDLWRYSRHFGFNTCETKDDLKLGLSIPSQIWRGELRDYSYTEKGKLKRDGTPYPRRSGEPDYNPINNTWTYHTQKGVMEYISTDIQSFWEYLDRNRQVSTGLTHYDRFVVVGDFDKPIEENTIKELEDICSRYEIPHFTYLEEHLDTRHYQIGWVLDEPFRYNYTGKTIYNQTTRYVSEIFNSDTNFKGWLIKNPNCVNLTQTYWFNDVVCKDELVRSLRRTHNTYFNTPSGKKQSEKPDIELPLISDYTPTSFVDEQTSRNVGLFNELRNWVRDYLQEHNELPEHKETLKKSYEISVVLGQLTHKGTLPVDEIETVVSSVEKHFKNREIGNEYSDRQLFGNLVKGCQKENHILDVYKLWKNGYKTGLIRKELGLTKETLKLYLRYVKNNYNLIEYGELSEVIPKTIELSKMNKTSKYNQIIEEVKMKLKNIRSVGEENINIY